MLAIAIPHGDCQIIGRTFSAAPFTPGTPDMEGTGFPEQIMAVDKRVIRAATAPVWAIGQAM
jgi:hypothetical protein